jgi:hypothetical protein
MSLAIFAEKEHNWTGAIVVSPAMIAGVWARLLLLIAGWAAAAAIALLAGPLFNLPKLPVLFTGGVIWTWLLLLQ